MKLCLVMPHPGRILKNIRARPPHDPKRNTPWDID